MAEDGIGIIDRVYVALVKLHAHTGRPAGKGEVYRAMTCPDVTPVQVYEALRSLRAMGQVESPGYGRFRPVGDTPQDRAISFTDIPGGRIKLEIGDILIEFTSGEWERVLRYGMGHIMQVTYKPTQKAPA